MLKKIISVRAHPSYRLELLFESNARIEVNFSDAIKTGGVLSKLEDPAFFAQVRIGENRRSIEWPDDIDFCADALWEQSHATSPSN
jgi:hypothetical protein